MLYKRIIPVLLIKDEYLVKGTCFNNHKYIGDPINAVRIYNEKEVDELCVLDISAHNLGINFNLLEEIASEAFMPMAYGGGIKNIEDVKSIIKLGFEKVIFNTSFFESPSLIKETSATIGASSTVICIDVLKNNDGSYSTFSNNGGKKTTLNPKECYKKAVEYGAGEVILNSISSDGLQLGYDLDLLKLFTNCKELPIIPLGGVGSLADMKEALDLGFNSFAAGSFFVYYGKHKAVLITYPNANDRLLFNLG